MVSKKESPPVPPPCTCAIIIIMKITTLASSLVQGVSKCIIVIVVLLQTYQCTIVIVLLFQTCAKHLRMHHCEHGVASGNVFAKSKHGVTKWKGDLADVWCNGAHFGMLDSYMQRSGCIRHQSRLALTLCTQGSRMCMGRDSGMKGGGGCIHIVVHSVLYSTIQSCPASCSTQNCLTAMNTLVVVTKVCMTFFSLFFEMHQHLLLLAW